MNEVTKMASTIQVRVEEDLKAKADALFRDLGIDTNSAIRMFLTQAVMNNGIPFEIKRVAETVNPYHTLGEEELLSMLDLAREHAMQGKYRDANDVIGDLRSKYGL